MFQFPRCPSRHSGMLALGERVAPFGDPRITACIRLPAVYRRYATSFIGTTRRGIPHLLLLSSLAPPHPAVGHRRWFVEQQFGKVHAPHRRTGQRAGPSPLNRDDATRPARDPHRLGWIARAIGSLERR